MLIGTLSDSHGLGQRVVSYYLSAAGVHVISLGITVPPSVFVKRASQEHFDAIAISVLMYRSALLVQEVRDLLDREGLSVPILVGGAPFNMDRTLWQQVGARAMGSNPAEGVAMVKGWAGLAL
ncbi:MAG: cobalamin B12-binding domain-containing protein [Chloroflexi bacterium]|nr:cobalamin B12-binding domain-containing protein [Chloroflexota bacterium]